MKQHITEEQLIDLNRENHHKYYKLKDIMFHGDPPLNFNSKLTIGKMIEILEKQCCSIEIITLPTKWRLVFELNVYVEQNLCDALWEAVKEIL